MKKLILISALFLVTGVKAQTKQYVKIETSHFKGETISSKTIKYEGGTVDINSKTITIDKKAPQPKYYQIVSKGSNEPQDEGFYAVEYVCITETKKGLLKALKLVAIYSPKNELADLIVKTGSKHIDYCIID